MAFFYAFLGLDIENSVNYCVFSSMSIMAKICRPFYSSSLAWGDPWEPLSWSIPHDTTRCTPRVLGEPRDEAGGPFLATAHGERTRG